MSGQLWSVPAEGGYLYSDELSKTLRMQVQPLTKFRQFADAEDGTEKGLHAGDSFTWDVYTPVATQGYRLAETDRMPETNFTVSQGSLTVREYGNSVPYTGLLSDLAEHDVVSIIDKTMKHDARKCFDIESFLEMDRTLLRVAPAGGNNASAITLDTNGVSSETNNIALGKDHVKSIVDIMKERNIPPYMEDDYYACAHPTTYRNFKNDLESIHQYTDTGLGLIMYGEVGRYENCRFVEQNHIPKGGAADSTTFSAVNGVADAWNNGLSSWCFFFGEDTVTEGVCIPEEIRAKIPGDFGRSRAIAWYYLGGFGLVHADAVNSRVVKWDSAA